MKTVSIILFVIYVITTSFYARKGIAYATAILGHKLARPYWYGSLFIAGAMLGVLYNFQWYWILNICLLSSIISMIYSIKYILK